MPTRAARTLQDYTNKDFAYNYFTYNINECDIAYVLLIATSKVIHK